MSELEQYVKGFSPRLSLEMVQSAGYVVEHVEGVSFKLCGLDAFRHATEWLVAQGVDVKSADPSAVRAAMRYAVLRHGERSDA